MDGWLNRNQDKSHWSVRDCFVAGLSRICAFTHRNYRIGLHTHEFIEINLINKGQGRHFMEGQAMTVEPGDAFVIPPMVEHGYIDDGGLDVCHMLLHPDYITQNLDRFRRVDGWLTFFTIEPYFRRQGVFRHGLRLSGKELDEVVGLFHMIDEEGIEQKSGFGWEQECLTTCLIIALCRAHVKAFGQTTATQSEHPHMKAVTTAMTLVTDKKIGHVSLDDLARAAGMERSHFCRVFRKVTGMTPMEFVRSKTIGKAEQLLREGTMNVSEIAVELGYCDSAHFCKSFLKATGRNPSELLRMR